MDKKHLHEFIAPHEFFYVQNIFDKLRLIHLGCAVECDIKGQDIISMLDLYKLIIMLYEGNKSLISEDPSIQFIHSRISGLSPWFITTKYRYNNNDNNNNNYKLKFNKRLSLVRNNGFVCVNMIFVNKFIQDKPFYTSAFKELETPISLDILQKRVERQLGTKFYSRSL